MWQVNFSERRYNNSNPGPGWEWTATHQLPRAAGPTGPDGRGNLMDSINVFWCHQYPARNSQDHFRPNSLPTNTALHRVKHRLTSLLIDCIAKEDSRYKVWQCKSDRGISTTSNMHLALFDCDGTVQMFSEFPTNGRISNKNEIWLCPHHFTLCTGLISDKGSQN